VRGPPALRYLVVDTRNWWFGKKVLVAPQWASTVSWNERKVYVDVSRDFVKNSPEWNTTAINREYEARLLNELILGIQHTLKITSVVVTHDMETAFSVSSRNRHARTRHSDCLRSAGRVSEDHRPLRS
jgi:hypothetical protein